MRIPHRQVKGLLIKISHPDCPGFLTVRKASLQGNKVFQVFIIERIGLAHIPPRIKLIIPDLLRGCPFCKKEHHSLHPGPEKGAAGTIQHGMEIAGFQQIPAQGLGRIIGIGEKGVLDHHRSPAPGLEKFDKMLEKEEGGLAGLDGEILLNLLAFLAPERRIGQDDVVAVLLLHMGEVLGQRVGMEDIGRLDPVQDQVHDGDDVGQALLFLAKERASFQRLQLGRAQLGWFAVPGIAEIIMGLAEEARRAAGPVIHGFADARPGDLDHGSNQGAGCVVLAAVAASIAHVLDLALIEMGELVFLLLGTEAELIHQIQGITQGIAALEFIADLGKDLPDLVLNGVRRSSSLPESPEIGKELAVHIVDQIIPGQGRIQISRPVRLFRSRPLGPAMLFLQDKAVFLPLQFRSQGPFLFQIIQVFKKEEPGGLLGIVQL